VAHEINNPVGFVSSNLGSLKNYSQQMIALLERCRSGQAGEADFVAIEFDYLKEESMRLECQKALLKLAQPADLVALRDAAQAVTNETTKGALGRLIKKLEAAK